MLCSSEDETAALIKKAKTDSNRIITYDPENRPEVSNLLLLVSLCTGKSPETLAEEIGDGGAGKLKKVLTESLNEYLRPLRKKRAELELNPAYIKQVLTKGISGARKVAIETLEEVLEGMNMKL